MRRSPRERRAVNIQSAAMRRAVNIQNAAMRRAVNIQNAVGGRVLPHRKNPAMIRGSINLTNRAAAPPLSNSQNNLKASLKKKLRRYLCVGQANGNLVGAGPACVVGASAPYNHGGDDLVQPSAGYKSPAKLPLAGAARETF